MLARMKKRGKERKDKKKNKKGIYHYNWLLFFFFGMGEGAGKQAYTIGIGRFPKKKKSILERKKAKNSPFF